MLRNRITSQKQNGGRVITNTIRWFPEQILGQPSAPQDVFLQVAGALVLNLTWMPPASFGGAPAITECRTHLSDDHKYEMKSILPCNVRLSGTAAPNRAGVPGSVG